MAEALVHLCAKTIASQRHSSSRKNKQFQYLFRCELPIAIIHSALLYLPINELIQLEERNPNHASAFDKTWLNLSEKFAAISPGFKIKLQDLLRAPNIKVEGQSHERPKNMLLSYYFKDIFKDYEYPVDETATKLPHLKFRSTLQEALGKNMHNVSNEKMMQLLGKHLVTLNLQLRHLKCLQGLLNSKSICLKSVTRVNLYIPLSFQVSELNSSLKTIFSCTSVQVVHIRIYRLPTAIQCVRDILSACSETTTSESEQSLWDQAVLDEHQPDVFMSTETTTSGLYDDMLGLDMPMPSVNLFHIKEFAMCSSFDRSFDLGRTYAEVFSHWFCLENLTINCCGHSKTTEGLLKGITRLCRSGVSHLRCLVVWSGVWNCANLEELGSCLNRTNICDKNVVFEDCWILSTDPELDDEQVSLNAETLANYTITDVTIRTQEHRHYYRSLGAVFPKLLFTFLLYFNPQGLSFEDKIQIGHWVDEEMHEPTVLTNTDAVRLQTVAIHQLWSAQRLRHFARVMSLILKQKLKSIELILNCCTKEIAEVGITGFKNVSVENVEDGLEKSSHSVEDYIAQM